MRYWTKLTNYIAYCANTIASLEENPDDFKFAMIYTTDADSTSKKSLTLSLGVCLFPPCSIYR